MHEAIDFLKKQKPVVPLNWSTAMAYATKDHVEDIGPKGLVSHAGTNQIKKDGQMKYTNAKDRMRQYGKVMSLFGESLTFNCFDAKEILLSLIVDDGSSSRGHRKNLFNPDFNYMGSFTGEHMNFSNMTCINYAAGYVAKGAADPIDQQMADFLKEEVVFNNVPPFVVSWK